MKGKYHIFIDLAPKYSEDFTVVSVLERKENGEILICENEAIKGGIGEVKRKLYEETVERFQKKYNTENIIELK